MEANIIYINPATEIIAKACGKCYKSKEKENLQEKSSYIQRRVKAGHESILEHGNIIIELPIDKKNYDDLFELIPTFKYLNVIKTSYKNELVYILSGSPRAFKHLFREAKNQNNTILSQIKHILQDYINPSFMVDFYEDELFFNPTDMYEHFEKELEEPIECRCSTIINIDNPTDIYNMISKYDNIEISDVLRLCTITIDFHEVSRIITQQLCRHRAAITQESQRYVDYSKTGFNNPLEFKKYTGKYDDFIDDDIVKFTLFDKKIKCSLNDLGPELVKIYEILVNNYGILKEDARAYLPGNVHSTMIMTFSLINFIKFLELRTDKAAQAEVRLIAESLYDKFDKYLKDEVYEEIDMYDYLIPQYKFDESAIEESSFEEEI